MYFVEEYIGLLVSLPACLTDTKLISKNLECLYKTLQEGHMTGVVHV